MSDSEAERLVDDGKTSTKLDNCLEMLKPVPDSVNVTVETVCDALTKVSDAGEIETDTEPLVVAMVPDSVNEGLLQLVETVSELVTD